MSDIVQIPLTKGYFTVIDTADFHLVGAFKWQAQVRRRRDGSVYSVYAVRNMYLGKIDGKYRHKYVRMHREILGSGVLDVDHRDGDGLNNQRFNLRAATKSQNMGNRRKNLSCSSPWKGVYWYPNKQKWHAAISVNGKRRSLGYFPEERDAATAYNFAAEEAFSEFAKFNLPTDRLTLAA